MSQQYDDPLIFIVDDEVAMQALIKARLNDRGYKRVQLFSNGEDCLAAMISSPSVVILDYNLASWNPLSLSGASIARKIRDLTHKTAIIIFSGEMHQNPEALLTAKYGLGIEAYIQKSPENLDLLLEAVSSAVQSQNN